MQYNRIGTTSVRVSPDCTLLSVLGELSVCFHLICSNSHLCSDAHVKNRAIILRRISTQRRISTKLPRLTIIHSVVFALHFFFLTNSNTPGFGQTERKKVIIL